MRGLGVSKETWLDYHSFLYERSAGDCLVPFSFRHIEGEVQIVALPLSDLEIILTYRPTDLLEFCNHAT